MLHSLKKKASKHTASPASGAAEPSAEFKYFKIKLETAKKNLGAADKRLDESKKHWLKHTMDQRAFSAGLANGIADTFSDTHAVAAEFASGASDRYNHWVRETDQAENPYNKIHLQLKEYLVEIADVEKMYKDLVAAKSESSRYQSKIDGLEKSKKEDDVKKERNLQKLDTEKDNFKEQQKEVTDMQNKVYGKSGIAQKMALVAHWQMNSEHVLVMQMSLEKTSDYATENYGGLAAIDIATMDTGDDTLSSGASIPSFLPSSPESERTPTTKERVTELA